MKNVLFYITLPVLLCMAVISSAAASVSHEAQFGKIHKSYVLNADGSQEMRVVKELTLFTHAAMNSLYGETFIVYDPAFQELVIHDSYTVQKDGSIVRTPSNAFVEVLPSAAADAPAYNGIKEMVVVHTGLELGATIHLDYSIKTRSGAFAALDVFETVEELSPIKEYVLSVTVPEGTPLAYSIINGTAKPSVKKAAGTQTVTWTLKNVKPRPRYLEVSVPAGSLQAISVSTYPSLSAALDVIENQLPTGREGVLSEKVKELSAGGADPAKAIVEYVRSLGDCRLTLSQAGYRIRPVSEIIQSAYGTAVEKNALASGLFKAAGLPGDVTVAFYRTDNPMAAGLAAIQNIMTEGYADAADNATKDISGYLTVVDLDGNAESVSPGNHQLTENDILEVSSSKGTDLGNGYRSYLLPGSSDGWLGTDYRTTTANTARSVNLLLRYLPDETYTCEVKVEDGMKAVIIPEEKNIDNEAGTVSVSVKEVDGGLVIVRSLRLKKQLVTPSMYPQYYNLMAEWNESAVSPLVFSTGK